MKTITFLMLLVLLISCEKESDKSDDNNEGTPEPGFLLPQHDAFWITYGEYYAWPEGTIRTINEYGIGKDTIVNGTNYSTLKKNTIFIYDYDDNTPNDTILCEGTGSIYRQDKISRKVYYPHIQNSAFQEERLYFDFSLEPGDTLFYDDNTLVKIYDTRLISLGEESLKLLKWNKAPNSLSSADSGLVLQAYHMPLGLPNETCDCSMPVDISEPTFILNGDTLNYSDIKNLK